MRESDRVHSDPQLADSRAENTGIDQANAFALPFANGSSRRKPSEMISRAKERAALAKALTSVREGGFGTEDECFEFSGTMALDAHEANCLGKSSNQTHTPDDAPQEPRALRAAVPVPEASGAESQENVAKAAPSVAVAPAVAAPVVGSQPRVASAISETSSIPTLTPTPARANAPAAGSASVAAPIAPPSSKIDAEAYAKAAARAEQKFQAQSAISDVKIDESTRVAQESDPARERMADRLSGAIQAEKERDRDARRLAVAAQKRAALVAERNDGAHIEEDMGTIAAPKRKSLQRNRPASRQRNAEGGLKKSLLNNAKSLGVKLRGGGNQLVGGAKALSATVPLAAGKVATMTNNSVKTASAGAVAASQRVTSKRIRNGGGASAAATGAPASPPSNKPAKTSERKQFGPLLVGFGAVCSLMFVGMVSVWTYKLGQRDSMEVPIIKAMVGDARVRPTQSGGDQVANQGLAVNEVLNGGGVAAVADEVMTAPRMRTLTNEDVPSGELQALIVQPEPALVPSTTPQSSGSQIAGIELNSDASTPDQDLADATPTVADPKFIKVPSSRPTVQADETANIDVASNDTKATDLIVTPQLDGQLDEQSDIALLSNEVTPEPSAALTQELARVAQDETVVAPVDAPVVDLNATADALTEQSQGVQVAMLPSPPAGTGSVFAPAMTEAPRARPADISAAIATAVDDALASVISQSASTTEQTANQAPIASSDAPSVIPLPAGTRMIQLGAFDSAQTARTEWERFSRQHGDLLSAKESYIQRIDNSGRIFYRLRVAGYDNREQTRAACSALTARGLPCITVTLR